MTFIYSYFFNGKVQKIAQLSIPLLVAPLFAFAQPKTCDELLKLLDAVAFTMQAFIGAVAVVMFVYASFLYLTAGDDSQKVTKAHSTIAYTVVGIIAALIGLWGVNIVASFMGANIQVECVTPQQIQ